MKTTKLVLPSIGLIVLFSRGVVAQQSPPNPTNTTFVNAPLVFSAPLRVCSTDGYLSGLVCLPQGSEYSCGNQITITQGTEVQLSASVNLPGGAGSIGVAATYSFSQAVTHTSGMCERCQQYVCYPNSTVEHWNCESFLSFWSWNSSFDRFTPGTPPNVRPSCIGDLTCPGCQPPAQPGSFGPPQPGTSNTKHSMIIDLAQYFAVLSGSPPAGHPILNPHQSLGQLNDWQRCQITASVVDAQSTLGIVFSHLVIKDIAGAHFFDLTMSPFNCPTATIPCVVVATSPLGPGSIQLDHTPCPAAAGASYVMAVTPNAGAFPVGWFFGIDIAWSLLLTEFLAGYPFTGTLDSIGATLIGPYGGIAPGTCYSVTVHFTPGYGDLISSRPAINVTVP